MTTEKMKKLINRLKLGCSYCPDLEYCKYNFRDGVCHFSTDAADAISELLTENQQLVTKCKQLEDENERLTRVEETCGDFVAELNCKQTESKPKAKEWRTDD